MPQPPKNVFYAQSGGVTAVINATAAGLIHTARRHPDRIGTVYAGRDGIIGALTEDLIDTSCESEQAIQALRHTPGGAFGSCRYKLRDPAQDRSEYQRLFEVFQAHNIGYFFYNGGGDSQDTALRLARMAAEWDISLCCIGIPKTVDNDLALTDNCPGFGSAAKYIAVSVREAALDVVSMARSSTRVFILEVMGRHAGWLAASAGLAATREGEAPHLILFPERAFSPQQFLPRVERTVRRRGYCVIVASEGIRDENGRFLSEAGTRDAFGHTQLGGVAPMLASLVRRELGYKYHWAVVDYLQRSARHLASRTDVEQAWALGCKAVEFALAGENAVLPIIVRSSDVPYRWEIGKARLEQVANQERKLPAAYLDADGFGISSACRSYLLPLIQGEDYPPYAAGLPCYAHLRNVPVARKLNAEFPLE